jgi:cysteine desulfurase
LRYIYLDHCATTPLDPEVLRAMLPYMEKHFGNPSSAHEFGREAKSAIEQARVHVAKLIGADPTEIFFTSGGTESDNLALMGAAFAEKSKRNHIITSVIEHHAVLNTCHHLENCGFKVTYVPVNTDGLVDPDSIKKAITPKTFLISIMHANNEIGTIEPISEIGCIARQRGICMHTDAVQTVGKIPVDVDQLCVDMASLSGHKIYGPKGLGALYVRKGTKIVPLSYGGHQEGNLRNGTENVPAIVGLGKACEMAMNNLRWEINHLQRLRDNLEKKIIQEIPNLRTNGHSILRLPHISNVSFRSLMGDVLVQELDKAGIAVSAGSACTAGSTYTSHVLAAINMPPDLIKGTVRFSFGKGNSEKELYDTLDTLVDTIARLRDLTNHDRHTYAKGCC